MGRWNPFNINNYTKPVKKTADDVLGIDDSGGLGGAAGVCAGESVQ